MTQKESQPSSGFLKRMILWLVFAALIAGILIPFFTMLWSDHTLIETRQECEMVADALLKQIVLTLKWEEDEEESARQDRYFWNEATAWACTFGGIDEEELALIQEKFLPPDAFSLLIDGEYRTLFGELPREEFDAVGVAAAELEESAGEIVDPLYMEDINAVDEAKKTDEKVRWADNVIAGETMTVDGEGDVQYLYTSLPLSDVCAVSRFPNGVTIVEDRTQKVRNVLRDVLTGTDTNVAVTSAADSAVMAVFGEVSLSEGDILEEPDERGEMTISDTPYVASAAKNSDYCVYVMVPKSQISVKIVLSPVFPAVVFALVFLLTLIYAWFLRMDILRGRVVADSGAGDGQRLGFILVRRVRMIFWLLIAAFVVLIVIVCSLCVVDNSRVRGSEILSDIENFLLESQRVTESIAYSSSIEECELAEIIRSLLEKKPERMEKRAFSELAWVANRELYLLDRAGKVEAASTAQFDVSPIFDPDSDLAPLSRVLEGRANNIEASTWKNGEYKSYLAARRSDPGGILLIEKTSKAPFAEEEYYAEYKIPDEYTLFSVDSGTGKILSSTVKGYAGETASSIGLTEEVCKEGFVGEIMVDGRRFLVQAKSQEIRIDLIASDLAWLLRQYFPLFLETIAVGTVLALLALYFVWLVQKKTWTNLEAIKLQEGEDLMDDENASFYRELDGELRSNRGAVGRWMHLVTPFRMMSADEKFHFVLYILLAVALAAGYLFYLKSGVAGVRGSTFAYLMQRTWRFGLNIYAFSYALLMITIILVISHFFRRLVMMVGRHFGNRGDTIARLIGSFIGYGAVICSLLFGLMTVGVNTMAILASVGIFGIGISIGANGLIADILAGISIVFEGEFRTGDIVEIGGFRGIVEEIGIRTTKVMSMENVKVFRNSEVSGVINLTQRHSIAQVRVEVSRREPIEYVYGVIRKELPKIRERIPGAVGEIKLRGIDELKLNTVVLLFETRCKEQERWTVEYMLKWELDVLMEKESIGIDVKKDL